MCVGVTNGVDTRTQHKLPRLKAEHRRHDKNYNNNIVQELLRKTGSMGQTGEFLIETPQMRLYNPKPRTYKYNIKNSNQRLVQMEKV